MDDLVHKGHRQRMKNKFSSFGERVFDTYELLEMLLYYTVPVRDTNPIAKRLLSKFGSLDGVLKTDVEELTEVEGVGIKTASLLKTVSGALDFFKYKMNFRSSALTFQSYDILGVYIAGYFENNPQSKQIILSFNNGLRLLGIDELENCDFSTGRVVAKSCIAPMVKNGASVAVIAHVNPHGPLFPTESNRVAMISVSSILKELGIPLIEHYVICGNKYLGFLNNLPRAFSERPNLKEFLKSKEESNELP